MKNRELFTINEMDLKFNKKKSGFFLSMEKFGISEMLFISLDIYLQNTLNIVPWHKCSYMFIKHSLFRESKICARFFIFSSGGHI